MTDARAWLDQVDARTNAATDGPWRVLHDARNGQRSVQVAFPSLSHIADIGSAESVRVPEDAEFIAHARTDLPAATAKLRAVLDLHAFVPARPGYHPDACRHCQSRYPCPTITALEDA